MASNRETAAHVDYSDESSVESENVKGVNPPEERFLGLVDGASTPEEAGRISEDAAEAEKKEVFELERDSSFEDQTMSEHQEEPPNKKYKIAAAAVQAPLVSPNYFLRALREGSLEEVHRCLEIDSSLANQPVDIWVKLPPLQHAIWQHTSPPGISVMELVELVGVLLDHQADINAQRSKGETALHWAVRRGGALPLLQLLLERGADVDTTDHDGKTPLACIKERTDVARLLIDHGADVTKGGYQLLLEALEHRYPNVSMIQLILQQEKIDLNTFITSDGDDDDDNDTLAFKMLEMLHNETQEEYETIFMSLIKHGADVNARQRKSGQTLLHRAIGVPEVQLLLEKGADVNAVNNEGCTRLFDACRGGRWEIVRILVDHGANVNILPVKVRHTPLSWACKRMEVRIVQLLLDAGAHVDYRWRGGVTALFICIRRKGNAKCATLLLERGADINATNRKGWTPLLIATKDGKRKLVKVLVDHGANVNVALEDTGTPLSLACKRNGVRMVQLLLEAGAQVDCKLDDGITALLICVRKGLVKCAALLLERGADIHHVADDGKGCISTPLLLACRKRNLDMIYLLIRLSPHHRRLGLFSVVSYPVAPTTVDPFSDEDHDLDGCDDDCEDDDDSDGDGNSFYDTDHDDASGRADANG